MQRRVQFGVLVIVVVLALVVGFVLLNPSSFKDDVAIVQSIIASFVILGAAIVAIFKFQLFRDFQPHLTITLAVSHRSIGESYVHIAVSATLHNSSKVKMELRDGFVLLQQIGPAPDEEVEALYAQTFVDQESEDILWPTLDEVHRTWDKGTLIIEPGEAHQETCEFIVSSDVRSILAYAYFYNPDSSTPQGWGSTTVHDMIRAA